MTTCSRPAPFRLLFREFFGQFLTSESSVSDRQIQQAIGGILAFVITPGLLIPFQMDWAFEFAAIRFPAMLDPLTRLLATVFLTYSMVVIGVVAAFEWDTLSFDRRDAMVLGPLPVPSRAIVAAKMAALAALLLVGSVAINVITAIPFSLVAGSHGSSSDVARLFAAHIVATMCASTFIFCALVTVRSALGVLGRGRVAIGTLLQFLLMSGLLSFIIFVPTSIRVDFERVRHGAARPIGVHMRDIPTWSPTNWFVGLYDVVRGAAGNAAHQQALLAILVTLATLAAAIGAMLLGYRHQMRLALAPAASSGIVAGARVPRALARLLAGRVPSARAAADFAIATLARSRAQQAPIAMNAAIAAVMIVLDLSRSRGDVAAQLHAAAAASPIPLLLVYWVAIGLRASFFIPSELPSAWTFRIAPGRPEAPHAAIRGAMLSLLWPIGMGLAVALSLSGGWVASVRHAAFVAVAIAVLVEAIALTVPFVPFTVPYLPGHARLKTRWPLYLIGAYVFGYALLRIERAYWREPIGFAGLLLAMIALAALLDLAGSVRAKRYAMAPPAEFADDEGRIAVLDIGATVRTLPHTGA